MQFWSKVDGRFARVAITSAGIEWSVDDSTTQMVPMWAVRSAVMEGSRLTVKAVAVAESGRCDSQLAISNSAKRLVFGVDAGLGASAAALLTRLSGAGAGAATFELRPDSDLSLHRGLSDMSYV